MERTEFSDNATPSKIISTVTILLSPCFSLLGYATSDIRVVAFSAIAFCAAYFGLLKSQRRHLLDDPITVLPPIGFAYCLATPILGPILGLIGFISRIDSQLMIRSTVYCAFFLYILSYLILLIRSNDSEKKAKIIELFRCANVNTFVVALMWVFLVILLRTYFSTIGGTASLNEQLRQSLNRAYQAIPAYTFMKYVYIACAVFYTNGAILSLYEKKSILGYLLIVPNIATVFLILILSGNRREFIYYLFGVLFFYYHLRRKRMGAVFKAAIVLTIVLLLYLSWQRTGLIRSDSSEDIVVYSIFGEFLSPPYTLRYYMNHPIDYKLGYTYLFYFLYLLRIVLPGEPIVSLASIFVQETNAGMGYAYMPSTEAYVNFGIAGCAIGPIILFVFYYTITQKMSNAALYYAACCETMNVFRSESSSILLEISVIAVTLLVLERISSMESGPILRRHAGTRGADVRLTAGAMSDSESVDTRSSNDESAPPPKCFSDRRRLR